MKIHCLLQFLRKLKSVCGPVRLLLFLRDKFVVRRQFRFRKNRNCSLARESICYGDKILLMIDNDHKQCNCHFNRFIYQFNQVSVQLSSYTCLLTSFIEVTPNDQFNGKPATEVSFNQFSLYCRFIIHFYNRCCKYPNVSLLHCLIVCFKSNNSFK